jgi:hypothetical protein
VGQSALHDLAPQFQGPLAGGLQGGKLTFNFRRENDGRRDAHPNGKGLLRVGHARPTDQKHDTGPSAAATGRAGFLSFSESTLARASLGEEEATFRTPAESGARNEKREPIRQSFPGRKAA